MQQMITALGQTVTLIHLAQPVGAGWRVACMTGVIELHSTPQHPNIQRSDDIRGVNCPACRRIAGVK